MEDGHEGGTCAPAAGDEPLAAAGDAKNSDGCWADANGDTIVCNIASFPQFSDLGPVVAETLRQHGIDASYAEPPDAYAR